MKRAVIERLRADIAGLKTQGLYKGERVLTGPQGGVVRTGDRDVINLCANNYLGLANHPSIREAAHRSIDRFGYGMASVRFICGTQSVHKQLEERLSLFLGKEDTILYSSCFDANGGLFETLLDESDAVISDSLNHASIIDGIRLCKAQRYRYANNDMAELENCLKQAAGARTRLIATDGVFSMDGTIANLRGICDLADQYDALVMVDDSHSTGFMGATGRGTPEHCGVAARVDILTGTLGLFTLIVAAYLFFRPAEPRARLAKADAARVRELLAKHGDRDSLGYFALRNDKSVIWSPTGKACIAYRVVSGVMLASGDPIGDPEAWPGAIAPFMDEAARHAWAPAVMGCSELGAEVWCREGDLTALELGDEAIVNVADFSLAGRSMRNVRQMVNRVAKHGYTAEVRRVGDIPRPELDAIVKAADAWRGSQTERGFSMALGRIGANGDGECVLVTAKENGVVRAVLQLVPWGADGLSLDLMQRDKGAQPGLNDFLIVETIKAASGLGVKRISLNFAVFRAALERGERIGAGPVLRAWRSVLIFMSKWFQIESLYKFNAKFCPVWQPRFFVFPSSKDAPRIALAALQAEAFLVRPQVELYRIARRVARKLGLARLRRAIRGARRALP